MALIAVLPTEAFTFLGMFWFGRYAAKIGIWAEDKWNERSSPATISAALTKEATICQPNKA